MKFFSPKTMYVLLTLLCVMLSLWIGRWAYVETTIGKPAYMVQQREKKYEIRRYDPMIIAQTRVSAESEWQGVRKGFMNVGGYIFGGNSSRSRQDSSESIAMTSPVISQKIAMTSPVLSQKSDQEYSTSFVMPSQYKTITDLPIPNNKNVELKEVPARTMVVYRYTWNANEVRNQAAKKKLFDYVEAKKLTVTGEPMFAFYNEPWSPPFLRKNEVMLEIVESNKIQNMTADFKIVAGEKIPLEASMIVLAGGCFWCTETNYENQPGVYAAISGYVGGDKSDASYKLVSSGQTDHREGVQVWYDAQQTSYKTLLDQYWSHIDPTDDGGQFADRGDQYRTAIFYETETEKNLAEVSRTNLIESKKFDLPIVTEVEKFSTFYPAEEEHQNFAQKKADYYKRYKDGSGRTSFIDRIWK